MSGYDVAGKIIDSHNYLKQIDKVHHEVHEGCHFTACYSTSGTAGSTTYFIIQLASTEKIPHFTGTISPDVQGQYTFSIDATVSSSYTAVTAYNNNMRSTVAALLNMGIMPTSSGASTATYGTIVECGWVGGSGAAGVKIGASASARNEWMLKNNTKFVMRYTSTDAYRVSFNATWYEE